MMDLKGGKTIAWFWEPGLNSYFHDPFRSTQQPGPLFRQRLQAASYGLFDVLQGFIHAVSLGVASGECRAAYNVAALFSFLKDNFEIHDLSYDVGS